MAPAPETRRVTSLVIWAVVVCVAVAAVPGIRHFTRERVAVRTAEATKQDLFSSVSTTGKVEPIEEFQPHAIAPGEIEAVYVKLGQKVPKDALLLKLSAADAQARLAANTSFLMGVENTLHDMQHGGSQDELNNLSGDIQRATLQRQQAAADLAALQKIEAAGSASPSEVAAAQQRLQIADSTLQSLQQHRASRYTSADIARATASVADGRAAVAAAQSALANSIIRTPIAGTVYNLPVSQYDYITAGEDLVYVADLTRLKVTAYFDEPEIGSLAVGEPVDIKWDAKPRRIWHGHIAQAPTTIITYGTRNVGECIITVDDTGGDLLPNVNVNVTVTTSQHLHVLSIPREALRSENGQNFVYRIVGGKLVRTPVQLGVFNLTRAEILGGLSEHDLVVLGATTARDLSDGLEVTTAK